jgi:hypothetical protein
MPNTAAKKRPRRGVMKEYSKNKVKKTHDTETKSVSFLL